MRRGGDGEKREGEEWGIVREKKERRGEGNGMVRNREGRGKGW